MDNKLIWNQRELLLPVSENIVEMWGEVGAVECLELCVTSWLVG